MFSRRVFGGTPDAFRLSIEYGAAGSSQMSQLPNPHTTGTALHGSPVQTSGTSRDTLSAPVRLTRVLASLDFDFTSDEAELAVIERFAQRKSAIALDHMEQRVVLSCTSTEGMVYSADHRPQIWLYLHVLHQGTHDYKN